MKKKETKEIVADIINYAAIILSGAAAFLWMVQPVFWMHEKEKTSHPVRVCERDVESLVYGYDSGTDFEPGVYTGGLVISPEDDFYNAVELMARVVEAEAGNQGLLGKRLVADVILNRVKDAQFPDSIAGVVCQDNAFTVIGNGMYSRVEISEETWKAVQMELEEISYPGVLYFCNMGYHDYGTPWKKIGDHYFSTK